MNDWIVLRCSGAATLRLADSLSASGYEVWTPREQLPKRGPRGIKRRRDEIPVMASYVFARARHLIDLLQLSCSPQSHHADFSVFHHLARIPLIADEALDPLRVVEQKRGPTPKTPRFSPGDMVKLTEGGFAGLTGVAELTRGQYTLVTFPGFAMPIKIRSLHLLPDVAKDAVPVEGIAAKRAA